MTIPALLHIDSIARTRDELHADPGKLQALERLQQWQVERLRRTYEDCYANAHYRAGLNFFIDDLYGPHDFRQRDRDLQKVIHTWYRLLPERGLEAITRALELESLTQTLDLEVVRALRDAPLTAATYADAYRRANRRLDRQRQIWLILSAGRSLDELIKQSWVRAALRLARNPARLAGVSALHRFLERGYEAFSKMGSAEELLRIIERRETAIMQNLFDGSPTPFEIDKAVVRAKRKARGAASNE